MRAAALGSALVISCAPVARPSPAPAVPVGSVSAGPVPVVSSGVPKPSVDARAEPQRPSGCGRASESVECRSFPSPESALRFVLEKKPRLLAIGEAHAQKGTENVASATRRFAEHLLPLLKGIASDLVIELWVRSGGCGEVERKVANRQQPVTQNQAATNQNEYVWLGHRAKALGILPHALTPSCEDYRRIASAGPEDVERMLEMIGQASAKQLLSLLRASAQRRGPFGLIVAYGGALHNDLVPREGRERWSFGPELSRETLGAYVELDLIVPEYVKDAAAWRAFPWYGAYDTRLHSQETLLFATSDASFTLIFPKTARPEADPAGVSSPSPTLP